MHDILSEYKQMQAKEYGQVRMDCMANAEAVHESMYDNSYMVNIHLCNILCFGDLHA